MGTIYAHHPRFAAVRDRVIVLPEDVTFDVPYTLHSSGIGYAFLTDPWGVYIELTEGLRGL